jgi:hypothetical protein
MKKTFLVIFTLLITHTFFGQGSKSYRQAVEMNEVPKNVRTEFKVRYPNAFVKMWYVTSVTYWYEDYGPSYYNGWYQPRTVVVYKFDQPANYEVEFYNNDENSRALYNRYGVWFETRTPMVKLPENVRQALLSSQFGSWKWSEYKERIEAPGMPGYVYRLQISKDYQSHIIRLSDQGKIVQIKTE